MYRSVSALILCGTLGFAFAPHAAAAKAAVCVRTSHGAVVCGQTVAHREASLKRHQQKRQAVAKHSVASREHTARHVDNRPAAKKDYRGRAQVRYERAGSDYLHKTGRQATTADPGKRVVHQASYGDRPRELASRERGVVSYTDRAHRPVYRAGSRNTYGEPQNNWHPSSERDQTVTRTSRSVVYRAPSHAQTKRGPARQDVYVDDSGQPTNGGDQVEYRGDQGDQGNQGNQADQGQPDQN
jgi:hypothetical protein